MSLFDSADYPETEPNILIAGDRWVWKRTDLGTDYPPAAFSLKYSARLEGSTASEIEITASCGLPCGWYGAAPLTTMTGAHAGVRS